MKISRILLAILCVFAFAYPVVSMAQVPAKEADVKKEATEKSFATQDDFIELSFQNLSKLYWRLGMLSLETPEDIDNFLLINECELYRKYNHNEFEWEKIRKATAQSITNELQSYKNTFETMVPIFVGGYDVVDGKFEILNKSNVANLKKVSILYNSRKDRVCGRIKKNQEIPHYPRNVTMVLNRPFSIKEFPVGKELAELYISEAADFYDKLPPAYKDMKYQRIAYLRLRTEVLHSLNQETKSAYTGRTAIVLVRVLGYEIYADSKKEKLLYKEDFQLKKIRKRVVPPTGVPQQTGSAGSTGQLPTTPSTTESGATAPSAGAAAEGSAPSAGDDDSDSAATTVVSPAPLLAPTETSGGTSGADHQ